MSYRLGFLILLLSIAGCGPELSKSDLGVVVFEVPKVAGSDRPYQMPQLGPPVEHKDDFPGRPLP